MSDAEWMYENGLDPFHRKDVSTGELVEWEGGLNPVYKDDEEPYSQYDESEGLEPLDTNRFHTFELAKAWAKENYGRCIIKSSDGHGYIVKNSLSDSTDNNIKKQRNKYSETNSNIYSKRKSFEDVMKGFWESEDKYELFNSYWIIFKKKWRLLIDFCLNYRNELEDNGMYRSVDLNKTEEISDIAKDLLDEFFDACDKIDLGNDGWEEITHKLLTLTGERLNVSTWWRHVLSEHIVRTEYIFYKRDMKANFIFSETNMKSKEEQYSEYLDHHMLYIFTRAIPVDYTNVY